MKTAIKGFGTFLFVMGLFHMALAQQGFGTATPNPNSVIDLTATDKGLLLPRLALVATDEAEPLQAHVEGMLVYNTATNGTGTPTAVTPGFYSNNGDEWVRLDLNTTNMSLQIVDDDLVLTDSEGNEVTIALADLNTTEVSNGLRIETVDAATLGHIKLGGPLTQATEIITDDDNTLTISGLEPGDPDNDHILMATAGGVLKSVPANKFVRFFYMPAVIFDTSTLGPDSKNLYEEYVNQFTGPDIISSSVDAPTIPILPEATDLYYYITYYDPAVFANLNISEEGELTYNIIGAGTPTSFMNIVFVIKE